jgi:aspartyl-tRNA(Asn)/glutamyl-tRNA(Gln) amidotransferase subunit C
MSLSDDQVRRLARLARIAVRADESAAVVERLNRILELVDEMRRVDTAGIEPMAHALDLVQPLRVDSVTEPPAEERLYLVPKVIE